MPTRRLLLAMVATFVLIVALGLSATLLVQPTHAAPCASGAFSTSTVCVR